MRWLLVLLILTGCTSQRQKQDAANAISGVQAMQIVANDLEAGDQARIGLIAEGTKSNIAATAKTKQADLPPPEMAPAIIVGNPGEYEQKAQAAEKRATAGMWAQVLGWGGGALAVVLGVLKFVPGAHQPLVGLAQSVLESRKDKNMREKEEGLALGARTMMRVIEASGNTELKQAINRKLGPDAKKAIDAYLTEMKYS